mmetsp:Transcript_9899/g.14687  ORF Transcript_9899/g.14687 Transcript_9899/m.14687 type:complete len:346 (+) Transcript_9899:598-1635(+)
MVNTKPLIFLSQTKDEHVCNNPTTAVEDIFSDKDLYKRLLLSMALGRKKPRKRRTTPINKNVKDQASASQADQGQNGIRTIEDGFFWKDYPFLEDILRSHMEEYYELSTHCQQSKEQQNFNNRLVVLIRNNAASKGWEFNPVIFNDKKLRDRIRCFFKTHIQNAKKRLTTMLKHPDKPRNKTLLQKLVQTAAASSDAGRISNTCKMQRRNCDQAQQKLCTGGRSNYALEICSNDSVSTQPFKSKIRVATIPPSACNSADAGSSPEMSHGRKGRRKLSEVFVAGDSSRKRSKIENRSIFASPTSSACDLAYSRSPSFDQGMTDIHNESAETYCGTTLLCELKHHKF